MRGLVVATILLASACAFAKKRDPALLPLVGTWEMRVGNAVTCVETHRYDSDGTLKVISGQEKTDQTFKLKPVPLEPGLYEMETTVVKDHGGIDCTGSTADITGASATTYAWIAADGKRMQLCYRKKSGCFGTFVKIQAEKPEPRRTKK